MNTKNHIIEQGLALQKTALGHSRLKSCASAVRCAVIFLLAAFTGLGSLENAQAFDCGSTGAYGPMNIISNTTLQLPPDDIFNCTTITVAFGATLTFSNNSLNTPVYLLATSNVTINGTIDVSGQFASASRPGLGGPGGFSGGCVGSIITGLDAGGDGLGPGGGKANLSCGVYGTPIIFTGDQAIYSNTNTYGNSLLIPLIGGSGGGGCSRTGLNMPGGGGGGAILIASDTKITVNGAVNSNGGNSLLAGVWWIGPGGSGGAIRLVAPMVTGTGTIAAQGCLWCMVPGYGNAVMSSGRIRFDCTDNQGYATLNLLTPATRGSHMIIFPAVMPALDIIAVGGQPIAQGTNSSVIVELAVGASTNQTVHVQARNFTNDVPISVVVTPQHGPSASFDAVILQSSGNPPSANVPVIIPAGSACQINAWTR